MDVDIPKYNPGTIVWVKPISCPWWPAEVIDEKDCPLNHPEVWKRPLIAAVKYLNEDFFDHITSAAHIQPFPGPACEELKLKGEKVIRQREKFRPAFGQALERVGLLSSPIHALKLKTKEPDMSPTPAKNGSGSQRGKKLDARKFSASPKPGKRRKVSTEEVARSRTKTNNHRLNEVTDSPTLPYPGTKDHDKNLSHASVEKTLGAAVKRSLETEYLTVNSGSQGSEVTYSACSIQVGTYQLSPHLPGGEEGGLNIDDCESKESYSAASAPVVQHRLSSSVSSFDSNLDNSEASDSDEDLPEGLSTSTPISSSTPSVRDVVWVKYRQDPFWPAVVRKIQKGRSKIGSRKMQIQFLGHTKHFKESFYMTYKKDKVLPFNHHRQKEFEETGLNLSDTELQKRFKVSLQEVDSYLNQMALGLLPPAKENSFFDEDYVSDEDESQPSAPVPQVKLVMPGKLFKHTASRTPPSMLVKKITKQNITCDEIKEKRRQKNQILLDFILSDKMKEYLMDIYHCKRKSERHDKYQSKVRQREKLRLTSGFGPFGEEDQIDQIAFTLLDWYREKVSATGDIHYVLDVWVPEAIVYSMMKKRGYGRSRAWELFSKGYRQNKIEMEEQHALLIRNAKNISPDDAERYDENLRERMEILFEQT